MAQVARPLTCSGQGKCFSLEGLPSMLRLKALRRVEHTSLRSALLLQRWPRGNRRRPGIALLHHHRLSKPCLRNLELNWLRNRLPESAIERLPIDGRLSEIRCILMVGIGSLKNAIFDSVAKINKQSCGWDCENDTLVKGKSPLPSTYRWSSKL